MCAFFCFYNNPLVKIQPFVVSIEEEQMGFLVRGKMGFNVNGLEKDLNPGDWYHAAIGAEHNAWTYDEPSVLVDIFSPPREDLS